MIASIDSTSRGSAGWDVERSGIGILSTKFQHLHGRVVPGDAANSATSQRARAAEKYIFVLSLNAPRADLVSAFRKWKRRRVVENVTVIHSQRVLDVDRAFAFDTRTAVPCQRETTFDRLFQPLIDAGEVFFLGFLPHSFIVPHKQTPWRVESEQRDGVKTLFAQLRRENAVVR